MKNKTLYVLLTIMIIELIILVAIPYPFFADAGIAPFYKFAFGIAWFFAGFITEISMIGYFVNNIENKKGR